MKKHILGFAVFSFIFISFAYFFSSPILRCAKIKDAKRHPKSHCQLKPKDISYEVLGSQFVRDANGINSTVKISWNGSGEPPKKVYLSALFFTLKNENKESFGDWQVLPEPFRDANEKTITIFSRYSNNEYIDKKENWYAFFTVTDGCTNNEYFEEDKKLAEAVPVLYVHGDDPVVRK